ncbi:MAG: tetratricopeptide repeat protein [Bacteroidetes bacterium]|nr:MAG: tetratricopeptide repeat protein [Bacteroidota bacterium]
MENTELDVLENNIKALEIEILALEMKYDDSVFEEDKNKIGKEIGELKMLFAEYCANLGELYMKKGNNKEAKFVLQKSLKIYPENVISLNHLAFIHDILGEKKEAFEALNKASKIDPKDYSTQNNLGKLHSNSKENQKAIIHFNKALEINAENIESLYNLGFVYRDSGEYYKSIDYYKQALEIKPFFIEVLNNLADIYVDLGELELAKLYFDKASESLENSLSKENIDILEKNYKNFSEIYQKSLIKSSSENINEFGKENLAFTIKKLCVSNFQSIKSLEIQIPTDAQFVCLLGQNGDGKTSILQALAVGLQGAEGASRVLESYETQIAVEFLENSKKQIHNLYREPNAWRTFAKCSNTVGYGVKRLSKLSDFDVERMLKSNPFYCLLNEKDDEIENIEAWFIKDFWKHKKVTPLAEELRKIIEKILSSITQKVEIVEEEGTFYYLEQGFKVKYDHLSAGSKSVLNLVGDILIRLIAQNKEVSTVENLKGIVLIDEVESHLHPKAQKDLMQKLSEIFPKVQFIVSTHSAICLLGMPENTAFFRVKRDFERGTFVERLTIDVANLLPNQLLTSPLFDMENIFSVNTESIYEVDTGIMYKNKAEKEKQEELRRQILEKYKKV